jgi:hypothetical protein
MLIDGQTVDQGTRSCVERLLTGKVIGTRCAPVAACKDHGPNTRLCEHFRAKGTDVRDAEFCRRGTFEIGNLGPSSDGRE